MKLSIIIPVYNVEQYIVKCLTSLEHQNLIKDQYEVLVLNDGSKDQGGEIAKKYCEEHPSRFRYFEHSNKGLSATRNRGIREAKGDYIWCIDSDDWIEENCLSSICEMLKNGVDILAFSSFIPEGGRKETSQCYNKRVRDKESLFIEGFADAAQFYIYRRSFLIQNDCFFKEGIKHEDTLFTPVTLHKAQQIVFYRTPVYHFLQRIGSITTVVDIKRIHNLADNFIALYSYSFNIKEKNIKRGYFNHMAHHIIEMLNYGVDNGQEGENLIKRIMSEHTEYWQIIKNAIDLKPRIIFWIIELSPFPFIYTYRLLAKLR